MDNLKRSAYAQPMATLDDGNVITSWQHHEDFAGFTKLEKAALIIAAGMVAREHYTRNQHQGYIAEPAVAIAKAVLEEANK